MRRVLTVPRRDRRVLLSGPDQREVGGNRAHLEREDCPSLGSATPLPDWLVTIRVATLASRTFRAGDDVLRTPPFFSMVLMEPTLSSSHVTRTRVRPSFWRAIWSACRRIAVA
jgi:hypothetical protein